MKHEAPRSIPSLLVTNLPNLVGWQGIILLAGIFLSLLVLLGPQVVGWQGIVLGKVSRHSSVSFGHIVVKKKGSPPVAGGKALCF